ncbi:MAG: polysaccharide deacetylase [Gammaproteobacteria bacterium]|nr:polysaccharide deacetylase [Gammaproteobacteria bacterium]
MLDVFITVDVEIWCDGWKNIDQKFPRAFDSYIYGPTPSGDCGLPLKLKILQEHGIRATFFVEPLFATRFGLEPLQEIVSLIKEYDQDIQLHLHTEWVDEANKPLFPENTNKRQHIKYYSLEEQCKLIETGVNLLKQCGCEDVKAFRAGSFGANMDTLEALRRNDIFIDSSYNYTFLNKNCDIEYPTPLYQPALINGVYEYPLSYFHDSNSARHAQLGACTSRELIHCMQQAETLGWDSFVILSHNFELMNTKKSGPDNTVINRFRRVCEFLDQHRDEFISCTFSELAPAVGDQSIQPPIKSKWLDSKVRMFEQIMRRLH